ncbi:MAG: 4a-hydroxytetrahydrobiopterin dehydratase [Streptomyces sp.]|jgi:4a-hydroxytetrahydrobiopterin dehydratase|nr:4a-hydroxytetrahydrobiopterin dehydratase [Streptomyces sp.]
MPELDPLDLLDESEIEEALEDLPEWRQEGVTLRRDVEARDFPSAIRILNDVAIEAEKLNHHPDVDVRYNKLHFTLTTHSAGGITALDTELARRLDTVIGSHTRAHA